MHHRFADDNAMSVAPVSYNKSDHTVEAVISMGSPVERPYGTEVLRITPDAVDLSRLHDAGIPLLDHHKQDGINSMLGRVTHAWIEHGALIGRFKFNQTEQGQKAEGMVARGEVTGVSAGYRVDAWEITDADGEVVDERNVRWNDNLTFTATRWALLECSAVGVPADSVAQVRSMPRGFIALEDIRTRMRVRHRMLCRHLRVFGHG
jgi:phage head maturation protease